jgi:putative membrane-bound dehydrogenase-like protein
MLAGFLAGIMGSRLPGQEPQRMSEGFGLTKVWSIDLSLSPKEYDAMQPALPGPPGAAPAAPVPTARESERNAFGTIFPWAEGRLTANGHVLENVSVRYAGDITYFVSAGNLKRPLKIRIADSDDQVRIGARSLQLHAMPLDPAKSREALAFEIFRAARVPAPATAFAEVTLTVPGRHDRTMLGLYTVVQGIDARFLEAQLGNSDGLLMTPVRMRGIDFLGDDWAAYKGQYQPQRDATAAEAQRVIDFARLINLASDEDFRRHIGEYLDVGAFLRFMAANALTSNLDSFFGLGQNYHLYLNGKTNQFVFLPGDLEFSLANFLLIGTPEQLMDLSLTKPYPGQNRLPDRLLALKDVSENYHALVEELTSTSFTREGLIRNIEAIDAMTGTTRRKEAEAATLRREPAAGFGGPQFGPQPPDLKTFAGKRTASIAAQLAGASRGFTPQPFSFGPAGGAPRTNNPQPIDEAEFRNAVAVPPEFEATLYAAAPRVNYPVAEAAAPEGVVFVASDEQGSLGRSPNGGKILRCVDRDGNGKADEVTVFARVEHPRGACWRSGSLWVVHPPALSVFHDADGDGVPERQETLVTGLTTNQINERGGDHTTNCVRLGIDGWLYIGVGDYGIREARGADGATLSLRGGGVVRVRPDGTELELYCSGLRNPFDLAIDPFLNIFTRDNTNDGGGWDTRVSHLIQSGEYGYPRLFANFTDEILPPLGTFGGGGGTGGLVIDEPRWPAKYRQALYTGDWGRSEVYRHDLRPDGATFSQQTELFLKVPRATGMDLDAQGHLYVASWRGGEASVNVGPNVGFVARVAAKGAQPEPFPDLRKAKLSRLIELLHAPPAVMRLHAQGEILRRGRDPAASQALADCAADRTRALAGRVAALWTLKQLDGRESHPFLNELRRDPSLTEFALRALTDRKSELEGIEATPFADALLSDSPRVRAQAIISLGRLNDASVAARLLPLTARPQGSLMPTQTPLQNQPDPDRVVPHLAVRTLVSLQAVEACLAGLDGPYWPGALEALRSMHSLQAVEGLIRRLSTPVSAELRHGILVTLIRLYHREAPYDGSWWGIRPDSTGPYYDRQEWEMSPRIAAVLTTAILDGRPDVAALLTAELARHRVALAGIVGTAAQKADANETPIRPAPVDPGNPNQLGNIAYDDVLRTTVAGKGDPVKGETLFRTQSCAACHTTQDGQTPKGPHLVDIGKRYNSHELIESILKPSAKIAQGYESYAFLTTDGRTFTGFIVSEAADAVVIREANSVRRELKRSEIEQRAQQKTSAMPEGLVANLTREQLADLLSYLQSLKSGNP